MVCIGIDVAKDKHDCFITNSEGEILAGVFTIPNTMEGFHYLMERILAVTTPQDKIRVGLEATGHYSYNLMGFLHDSGLATYVLNPLHTNLYRKSLSLRKTKTDRVDARTIAAMLMSDVGLKPYTDTVYHNEELNSLTRYRFDKVRERAKLKQSVSRLVCILFPELEELVPSLHMTSVYALLDEFPGATQIAGANLTRLKFLLADASKGRYGRDMALTLRDAARDSIGSVMPTKSLELRHTIRLIQDIMERMHSPITTIPGIGFRMGAMILAEVATSPGSILPTRSWLLLASRLLLTNLDNLTTAMPIWRNEVPDICALPSTTQPSTSATGTLPSGLTLLKNEPRASTTKWRSHTRPRNWSGLFVP